MNTTRVLLALTSAALLGIAPLQAQKGNAADTASSGTPSSTADSTSATKGKKAPPATEASVSNAPQIVHQHIRPVDQRGVNMFEPPKEDTVPYTGFKLGWGASFTQQFQDLHHRNDALPKMVDTVNQNQLIGIGAGFNNAVANLYLNAQMAKGIRVAVTTYMSSRHHDETWVKDGYLLVDALPFNNDMLDLIMHFVTVKAGHFEVNYGDQHFRRSDNGNTIYNPFVGNLIMDAFTTEIGGEVYLRSGGVLMMGGVTGGEVHGQVTAPEKRSPAYIAKLGYDRQVNPDVRVRLTGSMYYTKKSVNNTLYSGDRAGSRYYDVMENTQSTESSQAWSGSIQPGFRSNVRAMVLNPFIKIRGLELFGNIETARGKAANETTSRTWDQYSGEAVYRFLPREQLYVGARYNTASGRLVGMTNDVNAKRFQVAGGWFIMPGVLTKIEYVRQTYGAFPINDIRHGGKFDGVMVEGAVGF
ncbi:MAG TPA: hypothetical protein VFT57_09785 [Gemmatimonadaceae bacterium]|jgi:hypothetical protein|nr:hypothetical protein [Gemmatimonadaceae bacterium]